MPTLEVTSIDTYADEALKRWRAGDYELLDDPSISPFIRQILREKAERRLATRRRRGKGGDRRFFGEAYVASRVSHDDGWYGSFKWLTSPACEVDHHIRATYSQKFGAALQTHFGVRLSQLRERARRVWDLPACRKPMPPDLWLVEGGKHRFIESKLRGDTVSSAQIAGLAVIADCLSDVAPVSVEVIRVVGESEKCRPEREVAEERQLKAKFREYCDRLRVR